MFQNSIYVELERLATYNILVTFDRHHQVMPLVGINEHVISVRVGRNVPRTVKPPLHIRGPAGQWILQKGHQFGGTALTACGQQRHVAFRSHFCPKPKGKRCPCVVHECDRQYTTGKAVEAYELVLRTIQAKRRPPGEAT